MIDYVDLSYYKLLPQHFGSSPKMLVSEITNDIELYACTDSYNATIEYATSKIYQILDIPHEPVFWGTDLRFYENSFVTVTKFDLNKNWVYYADTDVLENVKNPNDLDFGFLLSALFNGNIMKEDPAGYVINNTFVKAFHFNAMFEIELAMFVSGQNKAASLLCKKYESLFDVIDEEDKDVVERLEDHIKRFVAIKKSDWFHILKFPPNAKFEKCKYWSIKKITEAQRLLRKHYE